VPNKCQSYVEAFIVHLQTSMKRYSGSVYILRKLKVYNLNLIEGELYWEWLGWRICVLVSWKE